MTDIASGAGGWLRKQSIDRRLGIQSVSAIILGILLIATVVTGSVLSIGMIAKDNVMSEEALRSALLEKDFASLERDVFRHALLNTSETEEGYRGNIADLDTSIQEATAVAEDVMEPTLARVDGLADDYVSAVGTMLRADGANLNAVDSVMESGDRLDAALEGLRDQTIARSAEMTEQQETLSHTVLWVTIMIALLTGAVSYLLARALKKLIGGELTSLRHAIAEIEAGHLDGAVPHVERQDEIGELARAAERLRDARRSQEKQERAANRMIGEVGDKLHRLAEGDLTVDLPDLGLDYASLRDNFNQTVERLRDALNSVAHSADAVKTGSMEISQASDDLARRTEGQAADLTRMTETVTTISGGMAETAQAANDASNGVEAAVSEARHGGEIVARAVKAMDTIESSTTEIGKIITVIDGISFQTNLLALNAGVEAARAGEVGRGFAVVASEVRALAQRSTEAAEDIRQLIGTSAEEVASGARLVRETGEALDRIIQKIQDVTQVAAQISDATGRQSAGLHDANEVMSGIDRMTQQNAAMVEESNAAARSLAEEADNLARLVQRFRLGQAARGEPAVLHAVPAAEPAPQRALAPAASGNLALAATPDEDWSEF